MQVNYRFSHINLILTGLRIYHAAVVPMRLRQNAGGSRVPLQLIQAAVGGDATENWSTLQVSCEKMEKSELAATSDRARRSQRESFLRRLTWFALESQDGLDLGVFTGAGTALGVHQSDIVPW